MRCTTSNVADANSGIKAQQPQASTAIRADLSRLIPRNSDSWNRQAARSTAFTRCIAILTAIKARGPSFHSSACSANVSRATGLPVGPALPENTKFVPDDTSLMPANPSRLLLNHIRVNPGYENIAQVPLGDVILNDTNEEALELFNKNGKLQRIVTKNGEIVSHQGILIGGSKDKLSGILAKKHELKELERQDAVYAKNIENAQHNQNDRETVVRSLETGMQKQIEQKNRTIEDEIEAEKAFYRAGEDLKNAHRHLEIVHISKRLSGRTALWGKHAVSWAELKSVDLWDDFRSRSPGIIKSTCLIST